MKKPCEHCKDPCDNKPDFCEAYIKYVNIKSSKRVKHLMKEDKHGVD